MRPIDLTTDKRFALKNPETGIKTIFLGSQSEARKDYMIWSNNDLDRPEHQGFYYWCTINLAISIVEPPTK